MAGTKDPIGGNLELEDNEGPPTAVGHIVLDGTKFKAQDGDGVFPIRDHRSEDQLVHDIAENSFTEFVYTGNRIDAVDIYTDATKTQFIRRQLYTYTANRVTQIVTEQYDAAGVLIVGETLTDTIAYVGNNVDDIAAVIS
ncbi:MAG: hypothetical protein V3U85_00255 [Hyphomicrobium sp.]